MTHSTSDYCSCGSGEYDLAVIGAGSGGFSAAIRASELGAKVALIGYGTIGGTCVNIGCVPSKALIRAAEALHVSQSAGRFAGITGEARVDDWTALVAQKRDLVETLRSAKYAALLPAYPNVTYIEGRAEFTTNGLTVDGQGLSAKKFIIATGASNAAPDIEGIDQVNYLTSTEALELETLPESLLVIGAGYIGVELAQMFLRMGVAVTLICRSHLLPGMEPEIGSALAKYLQAEGMLIIEGATYMGISSVEDGFELYTQVAGKDQTIAAQQVLVAAGRRPNTDDLGLESVGVRLSSKGAIEVDTHQASSNPNIYATGDVTGRDMFVYMAAHGARIAAENALAHSASHYDDSAIPAVVFSDPQVATVGLTEQQAQSAGRQVKTSILPLDKLPRALAARDTRGLIKLVADRETDRLLGVHILAPEGSDSIQTGVMAIRQGMTTNELGSLIFPYLTTVEGLKLAAQGFDKDIEQLSCCAG